MRIEKSVRLARVSKMDGRASKREKRNVLRDAQAAQVTYFDYLRAHLSLETGVGNILLAQD